MRAKGLTKFGAASTVVTGGTYAGLSAFGVGAVSHSSLLPILSTGGYLTGTIGLPAATFAALPVIATGCAIFTIGAGSVWAVKKMRNK
jgi:hypothetical protein